MWRSCIVAGHKAVRHADPALFSGLLGVVVHEVGDGGGVREGWAPPLLDGVERPFNAVATLVGDWVVGHWVATARTASFAVSGGPGGRLEGRLGGPSRERVKRAPESLVSS